MSFDLPERKRPREEPSREENLPSVSTVKRSKRVSDDDLFGPSSEEESHEERVSHSQTDVEASPRPVSKAVKGAAKLESTRSSSPSDEEAQECVSCREERRHGESCACGSWLCNQCSSLDEFMEANEWMILKSKCSKCGVRCCCDCGCTCNTCQNIGENQTTLCESCSGEEDFSEVCYLHDWLQCPKHKGEPCGQCSANRNYHLRYGGGG